MGPAWLYLLRLLRTIMIPFFQSDVVCGFLLRLLTGWKDGSTIEDFLEGLNAWSKSVGIY